MVCEERLAHKMVKRLEISYPGLAIEADCFVPRLGGFDAAGPVGVPLESLCFFVTLLDEDEPGLVEAGASSAP